MKLPSLLKYSVGALALIVPASAQVLMLDFGPTAATLTDRASSPYHTATSGFTDTQWNTIGTGDVASGLKWSNNTNATGISINLGVSAASATTINLGNNPASTNALGTSVKTGIYSGTRAAKDGIFSGTTGQSVAVGAEISGLAAGTYDIYITGRNTNSAFASSMRFYAGKAASSGNFDFNNGFALDTIAYQDNTPSPTPPYNLSAGATAQNASWQETGTYANYGKFTISLSAGEVLQLASLGGGGANGEFRGFLNSIQIVSSIPEPSSFALLAGAGALMIVGIRRRRSV